jgi:hypothetical protein
MHMVQRFSCLDQGLQDSTERDLSLFIRVSLENQSHDQIYTRDGKGLLQNGRSPFQGPLKTKQTSLFYLINKDLFQGISINKGTVS